MKHTPLDTDIEYLDQGYLEKEVGVNLSACA